MKFKCNVYRCSKKADTYLYLDAGMDKDDLPDGLIRLLGDLSQFLNLDLDESSTLAQVEARDVITALDGQGYFLQMPPAELLNQLGLARRSGRGVQRRGSRFVILGVLGSGLTAGAAGQPRHE